MGYTIDIFVLPLSVFTSFLTNHIMQVRIIILSYYMGREAYSIQINYQIKFEEKSRTKSERRIDKEGRDNNKKVNTKGRQAIILQITQKHNSGKRQNNIRQQQQQKEKKKKRKEPKESRKNKLVLRKWIIRRVITKQKGDYE